MINAFILAAGLGERLRPITLKTPKPLVPVLGKPLLGRVMERLLELPVNEIGVNLSYMADSVEQWLNGTPFANRIRAFLEDPVLGTGGALKNAEAFLKDGPFLVHNADVVSDIDMGELIDFHRSSGNLATLAVLDSPEHNTLGIDGEGLLVGTGEGALRKLTFTGISVYSSGFLGYLPRGVSSVVDAWQRAISSGKRVGTLDFSGSYWKDAGTPLSYAAAVIDALRADGETVFIHPEAEGCARARLDGYVVLEKGSSVDEGCSLRNCIVLPGVRVGAGNYENCITGEGFSVGFNEHEMLGFKRDEDILIGLGGSERRYYRLGRGGRGAVLAKIPDKVDFDRQISYTEFLRRCSVPVPSIIETDSEAGTVLSEDLGDMTLYGWLRCGRGEKAVESVYRKALDIAVSFHKGATLCVGECPPLGGRRLDYFEFRWETDYFVKRFLKGLRGITPEGYREQEGGLFDGRYLERKKTEAFLPLELEFHNLAERVDALPRTVIHRDFQSQNIMVTGKGALRVLDYQGARQGPPLYDAASLLWDPYYRLDGRIRGRLLDYYYDRMHFDKPDEIGRALVLCRLQRHMQALGAYGFLSAVKGKRYFRKHIPEGIRLLKEDVRLVRDEYPVLFMLVSEL